MDFDRIAYWRLPSRRQHVAIKTDSMPCAEIVPMYGGADGYLIKAALDHGVKGVWVANGDIVALLRETALMARSFSFISS